LSDAAERRSGQQEGLLRAATTVVARPSGPIGAGWRVMLEG
jgi:hypothetical protein